MSLVCLPLHGICPAGTKVHAWPSQCCTWRLQQYTCGIGPCTVHVKVTCDASAYSAKCVQIPNEALMKCDIDNITESEPLFVRTNFQVDAAGCTPETVQDLSSMVLEAVNRDENDHLFDRKFHPHSVIELIVDPLKYEVCSECACALRLLHRTFGRPGVNACARCWVDFAVQCACRSASPPAALEHVRICLRYVPTCTQVTHVQISLTYQLLHNEEMLVRAENARHVVNTTIGEWAAKHGLKHSQSLQPGFLAAKEKVN